MLVLRCLSVSILGVTANKNITQYPILLNAGKYWATPNTTIVLTLLIKQKFPVLIVVGILVEAAVIVAVAAAAAIPVINQYYTSLTANKQKLLTSDNESYYVVTGLSLIHI